LLASKRFFARIEINVQTGTIPVSAGADIRVSTWVKIAAASEPVRRSVPKSGRRNPTSLAKLAISWEINRIGTNNAKIARQTERHDAGLLFHAIDTAAKTRLRNSR
jgi:hypothetical protein